MRCQFRDAEFNQSRGKQYNQNNVGSRHWHTHTQNDAGQRRQRQQQPYFSVGEHNQGLRQISAQPRKTKTTNDKPCNSADDCNGNYGIAGFNQDFAIGQKILAHPGQAQTYQDDSHGGIQRRRFRTLEKIKQH